MSMNEGLEPPFLPGSPAELEDETDEISVDITEDNLVWLHSEDWELLLSPGEARLLAEALKDAADDAESGALAE